MESSLESGFPRATEKAAIAAARTMGYGDRKHSDQAAGPEIDIAVVEGRTSVPRASPPPFAARRPRGVRIGGAPEGVITGGAIRRLFFRPRVSSAE